jgi:hypothetical protein
MGGVPCKSNGTPSASPGSEDFALHSLWRVQVFAGLTAAVGILRFFNPNDLVINGLQFFATGTMVGALVILLVGPKKRM